MSLPAADDLFRPSPPEKQTQHSTGTAPSRSNGAPAVRAVEADEQPAPTKRPSGRVRHDEKVTVYLTSDELHDVEHARLVLRSKHGLAVDRGRLIREALSVVLADFEAHGPDSVLVRRLDQT